MERGKFVGMSSQSGPQCAVCWRFLSPWSEISTCPLCYIGLGELALELEEQLLAQKKCVPKVKIQIPPVSPTPLRQQVKESNEYHQ